MSKFIDGIKAQATGIKKDINTPLQVEVRDVSLIPNVEFTNEYEIGVKWIYKTSCKPDDLLRQVELCACELREDIYGDLRKRIIRLERMICEHNFDAAMMEMRDINKEIFR